MRKKLIGLLTPSGSSTAVTAATTTTATATMTVVTVTTMIATTGTMIGQRAREADRTIAIG
jgi:hypothetical protein